ncbi:MAG: hypothetical protein V1820_05310 [archaeon]
MPSESMEPRFLMYKLPDGRILAGMDGFSFRQVGGTTVFFKGEEPPETVSRYLAAWAFLNDEFGNPPSVEGKNFPKAVSMETGEDGIVRWTYADTDSAQAAERDGLVLGKAEGEYVPLLFTSPAERITTVFEYSDFIEMGKKSSLNPSRNQLIPMNSVLFEVKDGIARPSLHGLCLASARAPDAEILAVDEEGYVAHKGAIYYADPRRAPKENKAAFNQKQPPAKIQAFYGNVSVPQDAPSDYSSALASLQENGFTEQGIPGDKGFRASGSADGKLVVFTSPGGE